MNLIDWSALLSAIVGGLLALGGSLVLEPYRAKTAARYGLAQAKWELRRDAYVELLALLQRARIAAQTTAIEARHRGGEASHEAAEVIFDIVKELAPARANLSLWLADSARPELDDALNRVMAPSPDAEGTEFWADMSRACDDASRLLAERARQDLRLNLPGDSL